MRSLGISAVALTVCKSPAAAEARSRPVAAGRHYLIE